MLPGHVGEDIFSQTHSQVQHIINFPVSFDTLWVGEWDFKKATFRELTVSSVSVRLSSAYGYSLSLLASEVNKQTSLQPPSRNSIPAGGLSWSKTTSKPWPPEQPSSLSTITASCLSLLVLNSPVRELMEKC